MGQVAGCSEESVEAEGWLGWAGGAMAGRGRATQQHGGRGAGLPGPGNDHQPCPLVPVTPRSSHVCAGGSPGRCGAGPRAPKP